MTTYAIIAARGGSKGIPRKNLIEICGKPLLAWSIEQALQSGVVDKVLVSSDSQEILDVATAFGAVAIPRPDDIAGDFATSESAWIHALDEGEKEFGPCDRVIAMQATSPVREPADLSGAVAQYDAEGLDSLLSVGEVEDFFNWRIGADGPEAVNYDWRNRRRRQEIEPRYLENGSFYIVTPEILRSTSNRLGGKIGLFVMNREKMFQIDRPEDVDLCAAIMKGYGYA